MSALSAPPNYPQTAADLLAGLLRSQLFAESIFGQIREQSVPYMSLPAPEFATALVQKRVLTPWQARELLKGRTRFYAGTFRLLERLATGPQSTLFIAEQGRPQRLVLLKLLARSEETLEAIQRELPPVTSPDPRILRCIEIQQTESLRIVAFEFSEGVPLSVALASQNPAEPHQADLLRQLAETLNGAGESVGDDLSIHHTMLDEQGVLRFLREPVVVDLSGENPISRAMRVIDRFAQSLGGISSWKGCQTPGEVSHELADSSQPWRNAIPAEFRPLPRRLMNRYLRKGPSQKAIEESAAKHQLQLVNFSASNDQLIVPRTMPATSVSPMEPERSPVEIQAAAALSAGLRSEASASESVSSLASIQRPLRSPRRQSTQRLTWVVLTAGVLFGVLASQWYLRWNVQRAKAGTETPDSHSQEHPADGHE